jgi:transcriptional regulator with XRE-family HTH domain
MTQAMTTSTRQGRVPHFTLTDRLRLARTSAGLTQTELAERLVVSRTTVVKYEAGDLPSGKLARHLERKLYQWAAVTGVDPQWLMTGTLSEGGDPGGYAGVSVMGTNTTTLQVIGQRPATRRGRSRRDRARGPRGRVA